MTALPTTRSDRARSTRRAGARAPGAALVLANGQPFVAELRRLLELMAVPYRHCSTAAEALRLLGDAPYRCLVSCAEPPDMSIASLISRLQPLDPALPVIVVADDVQLNDTVLAMRAGAHAVIDARQLRSGLLRYVPGLPERG